MANQTRSSGAESNEARAVVWHGHKDGFQATTIPLPQVQTEEVLVQMRMASICGSDLHTIRGDRATSLPTILGHEMVGTVVATGGHVQAIDGQVITPGMRIVWSVGASCGACRKCKQGLPQKCHRLRKYGHEKTSPDWALNGGLATHCHLLPGTGLVIVPDNVPDTVAVPAGCATATAACAVRRAGDLTDRVVAVFGCGMLGLTLAAYARYVGAQTVAVCDPDPGRSALAQDVGATHTTTPDDLKAFILEVSDGEGADAAFEMSGNSRAVEQAIDILATGGVAELVGSVSPSPDLPLDPESIVRQMKTIQGTHNYAPHDLDAAVRFLSATPYRDQLAELVQVRGTLDDAPYAFTCASEPGASPRIAIRLP